MTMASSPPTRSWSRYCLGERGCVWLSCQGGAYDGRKVLPPGADVYFMRHIIHDWDDEKSRTILRNCRKAMGKSGKLLVVEGTVPVGNEPSISRFVDLAMMVLPGGMERTADEYHHLFDVPGFTLKRIVPTKSWISVIEGEPK
jgi:O-methyltransferase domain